MGLKRMFRSFRLLLLRRLLLLLLLLLLRLLLGRLLLLILRGRAVLGLDMLRLGGVWVANLHHDRLYPRVSGPSPTALE